MARRGRPSYDDNPIGQHNSPRICSQPTTAVVNRGRVSISANVISHPTQSTRPQQRLQDLHEEQEMCELFSQYRRQSPSEMQLAPRQSAFLKIKNERRRLAMAQHETKFMTRDVVLLSGPTESEVPSVKIRKWLMENKLYLSSIRIGKEWRKKQLIERFQLLFPDFLTSSDKLEFCGVIKKSIVRLPFAPKSVQPILGETLCKTVKQHPIYLRPSREVYEPYNVTVISSDSDSDESVKLDTSCPVNRVVLRPQNRSKINDFQLDELDAGPSSPPSPPPSPPPSAPSSLQLGLSSPPSKKEKLGSVVTVADLLHNLQQQIVDSPATRINICRERLWDNVKSILNRKSFQPQNRLCINFVDNCDVSSGAVDNGGLTKQFFEEVLSYLKQSSMFVGEQGKYLSYNTQLGDNDEYYMAGVIIAMSLVHGGPSPQFLAEPLFNAIIFGQDAARVSLDDCHGIINEELFQTLKMVAGAVSDAEAIVAIDKLLQSEDAEDPSSLAFSVEMSGASKELEEKWQRDEFVQNVCTYHLIAKNHIAIDRFKEGLRTLRVVETIVDFSEILQNEMCYNCRKLSIDDVREMFTIQRSLVESNRWRKEGLILANWFNFLEDVSDGNARCSLEQVVCFATGCKSIPAAGFTPRPQITFLHDPPSNTSKYPIAHTCSNCIELPVVHDTYKDFFDAMQEAMPHCYEYGIP